MPTRIDDGDFSTAAFIGPARRRLRFEDDPTSIILEQDCEQNLADWTPAALGTTYPTDESLYLVEETPLQHAGGAIGRWTRIYSAIPATRNEWQSHNFLFPGKQETISTAWVVIDNATSNSTTLNTTTNHGLATNDVVQIAYNVTANSQIVTRLVLRTVTVVDANTVTVDAVTDIGTIEYFSLRATLGNREPFSRTVTSKLTTVFALLGVTDFGAGAISTPDEIPITPAFEVTDVSTQVVQYLNTSTNPTRADYETLQADATFSIVAEATSITRVQGNLYAAATRYIRAL